MSETPPQSGGIGAPRFMGHTLPVGTRIGSFEITGLIGEGGFGIVYLAHDALLQRQVALKEYMPSSLASRATESHDVSVKSERHVDTFNAGLKSFVNEARLLARFDHPSLVKVHQFFEANHTAYMAMPYYEGPTLKRALAQMGHPPDETQLREWLRPLLDALAVMHAEQCYHRDIAPDNILLTASGPLLLDFGAARRVIGDMTHALTVVLKPGYAPIEQYGEAASMAQGPWTDLYATASVVHYAITGRPPMTSVERVMGDQMPSLSSQAQGRYSESFLAAIDATLALRPKDRPQDVVAFRELLDRGLDANHPWRLRPSGLQPSGFDGRGAPAARFAPPSAEAADPTLLLPTATLPRLHDAFIAPAAELGTAGPARVPQPTEPAPPAALPLGSQRGSAADPPARRGKPEASRPLAWVGWAAAVVLSAAVLGFYFGLRPGSAPPIAPGPVAGERTVAPLANPPAPSLTAVPTPAPITTPALATMPTPTEAAAAAPARADARAVAAPPKPRVPPATPPRTASESRAKSVPPDKPAVAPTTSTRTEAPPRNAGGKQDKCSDILQRASLQPISREEADYLRKECR